MRKYHVIDDDGSEYQVEELDEELVEETQDDEPEINALSNEEIEALRKLAAVADKLVALIETKDAEEGMEENNLVNKDEDNEELDDEDEDVIDAEEEEVIDTEEEEKKVTHDSKKSFGSLESKKRKAVVDNSLVDEVSDAWTKRYGGIK